MMFSLMRSVVDACSDCDVCRFLMDESCLFFPELYRLYDQEKETGVPVEENALSRLSDLCTLCGLCPCPDIRMKVIQAKTERARDQGMPLSIKLLADVQRFGQIGARAPKMVKRALSSPPLCGMAGKAAGIHPERRLPRLPDESFFVWARRKGLDRPPDRSPGVAYFAGCTAGYLFPEVARAAVTVLERNGVSVFVPPQQCCGMPTLLEGDDKTTLRRAGFNLEILLEAVADGFDIVCSCPTCGFLMTSLLRERAVYSEACQRLLGAGKDEIKVPEAERGGKGAACLKKSMYESILKDDGYFSSFDPLQRIALSENALDLGAYLNRLRKNGGMNSRLGELDGRAAYFAPCHQREQGIGAPYLDLLNRIPGLTVEPVGGAMDCCGMGGSLGFKKDFHDASTRLAAPLVGKIRAVAPDAVVTDCLSCRLQFQHLLPYPARHPLEILERAYEAKTDNISRHPVRRS